MSTYSHCSLFVGLLLTQVLVMPHSLVATDPAADGEHPGTTTTAPGLVGNDDDMVASLTGHASIQQQLESEFCESLSKFGVTTAQIESFKQGDSDLFFSLGQKSEAEIKYIEKESEYFARCVKAEEETEELGKDNKKLHNQMNELKYQLAKVKVEGEKVKEERDRLRETVESLKKELAAQKGASK